jgi:hypothetical protein
MICMPVARAGRQREPSLSGEAARDGRPSRTHGSCWGVGVGRVQGQTGPANPANLAISANELQSPANNHNSVLERS